MEKLIKTFIIVELNGQLGIKFICNSVEFYSINHDRYVRCFNADSVVDYELSRVKEINAVVRMYSKDIEHELTLSKTLIVF